MEYTKMEERADIEKLLETGQTVQVKPQGFSMYPLLVPGRDEALISPAKQKELKRGDVVLYRRTQGILVLHRIWKIKEDGFYLVGDNQTEIEGPLEAWQICGRLSAFVRKGKKISVMNPLYKLYAGCWLALRPFRHPLSVGIHRFKSGRKRD